MDTSSGKITLKEEPTQKNKHSSFKNTPRKRILVRDVPDDSILIKLDLGEPSFKTKSAYLNPGLKLIHKGCDYCLICPSLKRIFFIELKTRIISGYKEQLLFSSLFIDYCITLWKYYSETEDYTNFEKKYILFCEKDTLQPTSPDKVLMRDIVLVQRKTEF